MLTSQQSAVVGSNGALAVLAIGAVALRIFVRKQKVFALQADDYLILGALVRQGNLNQHQPDGFADAVRLQFFSVALCVTNIVGAAIGGFGVDFALLDGPTAVRFLKILFVLQFWYIIAVGLVKLSILCFYGRLFSARRFPLLINISLAIVVAWLISFFFATLFQIWPIWCNWTLCPPTTNYPVMYMCSSVTDIVLDVAILCLPASFVRNLQITAAQKVGVTSIFGLGIFCTISSIARLVYTVNIEQANVDESFAANFGTAVVNMIMWSGIEACASVICACLPCYAPLMKASPRLRSLIASIGVRSSARRGSSYSRGRSPGKPLQSRDERAGSMERMNPVASYLETTVIGGKGRWGMDEVEMGHIRIETTSNIRESV